MEFDIGTLSIILGSWIIRSYSLLVFQWVFASGFMGAVLVFLYIGDHALGILLSRYYSLVVTYSFLVSSIIYIYGLLT
jgi:hypothetical protein